MGHEINLEKHGLRTDLAIEAIANLKSETGVKSHLEKKEGLTITTVLLDETGANKIGKPKGSYITIEFEDITDHQNQEKVKQVFSEQLKKMVTYLKIKTTDLVLIVGLGKIGRAHV